MTNNKVPILIPSFEPDENLIKICDDLITYELDNIIVINDGSSEIYNPIFKNLEDKNIKVLYHNGNKGKGRALKTGFEYVLNSSEEIIGCVTADSDGQHTPKDIGLCINNLIINNNSLILGTRDFDDKGVPIRSMLGNKITRNIFSYLSGVKITDTQTGLRGIPKDFMEKSLNIQGERFEFEMNMLLLSKDYLGIIEVPIETVYESKTDHKSHFNTVSDSIKVYKVLLKMFMKYFLSSISSTGLDLILFFILVRFLESSYPRSYIMISTIIARVISAFYNYIINYKYVFHSIHKKTETILKYFMLAVTQMLLSGLIVTFLSRQIIIIDDVLIKFFVDMILFFFSYYIQRRFIF